MGDKAVELAETQGPFEYQEVLEMQEYLDAKWDDYVHKLNPRIYYHDGKRFSTPTEQSKFRCAITEIEKIQKFISPEQREQMDAKFRDQSSLQSLLEGIFKELAEAKEQEIRDNTWNPYVVNCMPYQHHDNNRWHDFCMLAHKKMCEDVNLAGVPSPEDGHYSILPLQAGINGSNASHQGITVAKLLHAYTTYQEIIAYEKLIGKHDDVDYIPPEVLDSSQRDDKTEMNASMESLLKRPVQVQPVFFVEQSAEEAPVMKHAMHSPAQSDMGECMRKTITFCVCLFTIALVVTISAVVIVNCNAVRTSLNKQNGQLSDKLARRVVDPRSGYGGKVEAQGLWYHDEPTIEWTSCDEESYWNERGQIEISQEAEKEILEATQQMHFMSIEAANKVINDPKLLRLFHIPSDLWPAIRKSWGQVYENGKYVQSAKDKKHFDFLGRFDWSWNGVDPPKLLEYNADTPSLLLESSNVSLAWYNDKHLKNGHQQSNYLMEALNVALKKIYDICDPGSFLLKDKIGFVAVDFDDESWAQMAFLEKLLRKITKKSGLEYLSEMTLTYRTKPEEYLGSTDICKPAFDIFGQKLSCVINQYPKEWLINEIERDELLKYDVATLRSFEPWWKLILGNKALLPLLWSMYPHHPNLLPAFYDDPTKSMDQFAGYQGTPKSQVEKHQWVSKPLFGREGIGVLRSKNYSSFAAFLKKSEDNYGKDRKSGDSLGKSIYQLFWKLPDAQGRVIQTSSWVVGGQAAGINFREGKAGTDFIDLNPFIPHIVKKSAGAGVTLEHKLSQSQKDLLATIEHYDLSDQDIRKTIYGRNKQISKIKYTVTPNFYEKKEAFKYLQSKQVEAWPAYSKESSLPYHEKFDTLGNLDAQPKLKKLLTAVKCLSETSGTIPKKQLFNRKLSEVDGGLPEDSAAASALRQLSSTDFQKFTKYVNSNPRFVGGLRKVQFGNVVFNSVDYKGLQGGRWYSVDSEGRVRMHNIQTAGIFYAGLSARGSMRSRTKIGRGALS